MNFLLITTTCLLAICCTQIGAQDDYCFGKDTMRPQTRHFTSKTAYQIAKSTNMDKQYLVPGCTPQKIWILHRHGTRLPSKSTIQKAPRLEQLRDAIADNYRVKAELPDNALCNEDLIAIKMWKWNASITPDMENYLTGQGYEDLRGTAKTYQKYYPEVLVKDYSSDYYKFRHTDLQRTTESFKAFAEGLFGPNNAAKSDDIPEKDLLLRPYDYCQSWSSQNFKGAGSESAKFRNLPIWNQTMYDISRRLGFKYTLETEDIELMYDMCRYEQAWQVDRTSVWCAAFTADQVTVFEYEDDLKYYYKSGYGFEANSRLNCRAAQDMITHLGSNSMPNVVTYFGHSTGVQTLLNTLGIDKDEVPLLASNFNDQKDRKWATSRIDPFASNFLAVKYHCDAETVNKEKVIFFVNQDAVDLSWCKVGLCNWSDVLDRYSNLIDANCDSYYCGDGATAVSVSLGALLMTAIVYLINVM
ncbi:multiple inositol polyphosphate phosphatase 1 [Stomoxys calcitrans]|uniref:multiple inositol polyphosphate phosphatase 1 n=1 Tax=Stomoxys calcitrans TaxID=35570 RepID=UPI0027E26241|nr:multiple inositol polyphosphate phosphatase 1 [Stomoxys calcitrans]